MNKLNNQAIAEAAYYIWKNNGCPANSHVQDWNAAISQLSAMSTLKTAGKKIAASKTLAAKKISLKAAALSSSAAKKTSVRSPASKKSK